jgi:alanyl-tRNA synthetase
MISSDQIRKDFLDFFKERGHEVVPSSPVAPKDDPTLLFANAGMNQFKDVFLGEGTRPYNRATSTQKCLRVSGKHNDLDEVGRDTYHHTLFEMLGNWSFGDYYKRDAILWAWELLTKVWGLPKEDLYATVFEGDDQVPFDEEAFNIWRDETDIPNENILRCSKKDNFWEMGETGPCGPCTEIHIDRGEAFGKMDPETCFVNTDADRYIELWNLVFIQYHRDQDGALHDLPQKHVDTGAGFERICAVLQNKSSNYDTDVFQPLIQKVATMAGVPYSEETGTPHRVISDHVRALCTAISDGAQPSNEGRGYVLRRILRRAARFGRELGFHTPFLAELAEVLAAHMGDVFPELPARLEHVQRVLTAEEVSFGRTLDRGLERFEQIHLSCQNAKTNIVSGEEAFRLYDTYGFPLDLTVQMAAEKGLEVDEDAFQLEMNKQRAKSRGARKVHSSQTRAEWSVLRNDTDSFTGYASLEETTSLLRWREEEEGERAVVLAKTPFYAESGGQAGDRGLIEGEHWKMVVRETRKEDIYTVHVGQVHGTFCPSDTVQAKVEVDLRQASERNHTATHLLQSALKAVLGDHVQQEGSLVEPGRLRFDFSHTSKLHVTEIARVEKMVQEQILTNTTVQAYESSYDAAVEQGVTALFGEKYGDEVRVVAVEDFSHELCGGTHVSATGEIGAFLIVSESSVAQGVRRIEAITGLQALLHMQMQREQQESLRDLLACRGADEVESLRKSLNEKREMAKEIADLKGKLAELSSAGALDAAETVKGVLVHAQIVENADMPTLKKMCDTLREDGREMVQLLAAEQKGKALLAVMVSDAVIASKGIKAGDIVRELAPIVGGGGGGRPTLATAGGKNPRALPDLLVAFNQKIRDLLEKA